MNIINQCNYGREDAVTLFINCYLHLEYFLSFHYKVVLIAKLCEVEMLLPY